MSSLVVFFFLRFEHHIAVLLLPLVRTLQSHHHHHYALVCVLTTITHPINLFVAMLTMTETWMSSRGGTRQQDPRHPHDLYGDSATAATTADPHRHMRSSLGQLIERSISAPPSSDSNDDPSQAYSMRNVSLERESCCCFFERKSKDGSLTHVIFFQCLLVGEFFSPCYGLMLLQCQRLHRAAQQVVMIRSLRHQLYRMVEPVWKDLMTISPPLEALC